MYHTKVLLQTFQTYNIQESSQTGYLEIYIQYKNLPTVHQFYNITHLHFFKYIEESLHELDGFFSADVS